jgi:molecular chaperone GrpE
MDDLQEGAPDAPETTDEILEGIAREEAPDAQTMLEREVAMLRTQSDEYLDGWRRAQADLINQRRRHERERAELQGIANARLVTQLLPVVDDFERALQHVPADLEGEQWAEGIRLIARKIKQIFESENVQEIPAAPGTPFDPNVHEAIMQEQSQEFEPGQIVAEIQKGYKMGERVLRASKVKVAR